MLNFVKRLCELSTDTGFRYTQNKLAEIVYDTLIASYEDGEVKTVEDICDKFKAFNSQKLLPKDVTIYAEKFHGPKSFVNFKNVLSEKKDDKGYLTKEMADMIVIAIATEKDRILFEKIAFIQNKIQDKNSRKNAWDIDQDQLFLLQNFPTFKAHKASRGLGGKKGLFYTNEDTDYVLHNTWGKLGNYGLFRSPGEMIFANAKLIAAAQDEPEKAPVPKKVPTTKKVRKLPVSFDKLKSIGLLLENQPYSFPCSLFPHPYLEEFYYLSRKYGFNIIQMPFLRSVDFASNVYDFVRNWTMFSIGEPVTALYLHLQPDPELARISHSLLRKIGLNIERLSVNHDGIQGFDCNTAVFVIHYDIREG